MTGAKRRPIAVAIPKVVFEEVTNKWREEVSSLVVNARNLISRLGMGPGAMVMPDPEQQADGYAKWLRGHLSAHKVQILGIPDVSHEALLRTALQKKKPFNAERRRLSRRPYLGISETAGQGIRWRSYIRFA